MSERKYYVLCGANCKFESMTKEQILTAIEQAVNDGEIKDIDSGFVTTLKEQNKSVGLKFWVGTQAEYNALAEKPNNTFCIITDDTEKQDLFAAVASLVEDGKALSAAIGVLSAEQQKLATSLQNLSNDCAQHRMSVVDYVTEVCWDGDWYCRKYLSGWIEARINTTVEYKTCTTAKGGIYVDDWSGNYIQTWCPEIIDSIATFNHNICYERTVNNTSEVLSSAFTTFGRSEKDGKLRCWIGWKLWSPVQIDRTKVRLMIEVTGIYNYKGA